MKKFYFVYFLLVSFFLIFLNLPDIDLKLEPILHHRSIITHSILIPFICKVLFEKYKLPAIYLSPLFFVFALHLCADLFSKGWSGYALIYVPIFKSIGKELSIIWILSNTIFCIFYTVKLIKQYNPDFYKLSRMYLAAFIVILFYTIGNEENILSLILSIYILDIFSYKYINKYVSSKFLLLIKRYKK